MKKSLLLVLLAFINLSVFSQTVVYNSNMIGQKLDEFDGSSDYTLKEMITDNVVTSFLYYKGKEIKKIETSENGNYVNQIIQESNKIVKKTFFKNLLIRREEGLLITDYNYDGDKLITKIQKQSNVIINFSKYYYNRNKLIAIFRVKNGISEYSVFEESTSTDLIVSKGSNYTKISANDTILTSIVYNGDERLIFNDATLNEDGSLVIDSIKKGLNFREYYGIDGLLVKKEVSNNTNEIVETSLYEYDDNDNLTQSIVLKVDIDNKNELFKTITTYENGIVNGILIQKNGIIISSSTFDEAGKKIETLYKKGERYCTIKYALDGKKVIDIQYEEM